MRPRVAISSLIAIAALFAVASAQDPKQYGQYAPADAYENGSPLAYYGSENEWTRRQFSDEKADQFYKRRGQQQLLTIIEGDLERAADLCQRRLTQIPNDLESLFNLAIVAAQRKDVDAAFEHMHRAVSAGLPVERFLAGPRELLKPLITSERFQQYLTEHPVRLLHGPLLGSMTDQSTQFWVRTADASTVRVRVYHSDAPHAKIADATAQSRPEADYTAIVTVDGLQPYTRYAYEVLVDGQPEMTEPLPTFTTFPARGQPAKIRIAFGGGAGYNPQYERMWSTIAAYEPDALLLLGDNVYIDLAEQPGALHRYTYHRRQSRSEYRGLTRSTPVYAIWDDHDCAIDDVWMGPYRDRPDWKQPMLALFKENWINPGYGNADWPACWFQFSVADIDFFMLDGRFYRTNPFGQSPTMLGPTQKAWLLDGLARSNARFKVLVSPVAWAPGAKPGSRDTWDGFREERADIFAWIETNQIDGVVLVSADRHRSDAWRIERPQGYPLYDFMSSRLTNVHLHECFDEALFCYNEKCSFGLLTFDTTLVDPEITYDVVNIDGKVIHSMSLRKSRLTAK